MLNFGEAKNKLFAGSCISLYISVYRAPWEWMRIACLYQDFHLSCIHTEEEKTHRAWSAGACSFWWVCSVCEQCVCHYTHCCLKSKLSVCHLEAVLLQRVKSCKMSTVWGLKSCYISTFSFENDTLYILHDMKLSQSPFATFNSPKSTSVRRYEDLFWPLHDRPKFEPHMILYFLSSFEQIVECQSPSVRFGNLTCAWSGFMWTGSVSPENVS